MPITWQSLLGHQVDPARMMQGAATAFDGGFDRLSKVIEDRQNVNQGAADRARDANVQALLDAYQGANTPDAVTALQADPRIAALKAAIDPRDAAKVRGADEARLTAVRALQQAGRDAGEKDFLYNNQGLIAEVNALSAQGKQEEAMAKAAPLMGHAIYGESIAKAVAGGQQVKTFNDTLENNKVRREAEVSNAESSKISANAAARNAETNVGQLQISRLDHALQQQQRDREALGKIGAGAIGGQGSFDAMIGDIQKSSEDKGQVAKLTSLVSDALKSNPQYANLPTERVKAIALAQLRNVGHGFWNMLDPRTDTNSTVLDALKADFDKALTEPSISERMKSDAGLRDQLIERMRLSTPILDEANRGVFPQTQAQVDAALARAAAGAGGQPAVTNAPAPVPSPAGAPSAAPVPAADAKLAQLAQTELALRDRGEIKELSPEVQRFVDAQSERDRQALVGVLKNSVTGTQKLGAAAADIFTLPARAAEGVVNNGIRGINALGARIPYLPDTNGVISSMTPYSDMLARRSQGGEVADLKAAREKLKQELAAAAKKAR